MKTPTTGTKLHRKTMKDSTRGPLTPSAIKPANPRRIAAQRASDHVKQYNLAYHNRASQLVTSNYTMPHHTNHTMPDHTTLPNKRTSKIEVSTSHNNTATYHAISKSHHHAVQNIQQHHVVMGKCCKHTCLRGWKAQSASYTTRHSGTITHIYCPGEKR